MNINPEEVMASPYFPAAQKGMAPDNPTTAEVTPNTAKIFFVAFFMKIIEYW